MSGRGRYRDGTVYQDGRGRWVASVSLGKDLLGKRQRRVRTAATKAEADRHRRQMLRELEAGRAARGPAQTLDQFVEWWLASEAPHTLRPDTVSTYAYLYRHYARPGLGHARMRDVQARDVQDLMTALRGAGRSVNTVKRVRGVLHLLFNHAKRLEVVPTIRCPAPGRPPRATARRPRSGRRSTWTRRGT